MVDDCFRNLLPYKFYAAITSMRNRYTDTYLVGEFLMDPEWSDSMIVQGLVNMELIPSHSESETDISRCDINGIAGFVFVGHALTGLIVKPGRFSVEPELRFDGPIGPLF